MNLEIQHSDSATLPLPTIVAPEALPPQASIAPLNNETVQPQVPVTPDTQQVRKGFDHSQSLISYMRERRSDIKKIRKVHGGKMATGANVAILSDFLGANIASSDKYEKKYAPLAGAIDPTSIDQDSDGRINAISNRLRSVSKLGAEKIAQASLVVGTLGQIATANIVSYASNLPNKLENIRHQSAEAARKKTAKARYLGRIGLGHMVVAGQAITEEIQANFNTKETDSEV